MQQAATDSLDQSDLSGALGDAETSRTDTEGTDLEGSVSLNHSQEESRDTRGESTESRGESRDTREEAGPVSPLGNMWDRYLKRTLGRKSQKSAEEEKSKEGDDSGIAG